MAVNLSVKWLLSGVCCLGSEFLWGKIVQVQEHTRPLFLGLLREGDKVSALSSLFRGFWDPWRKKIVL